MSKNKTPTSTDRKKQDPAKKTVRPRGRPKLAEDERSVQITFRIPADLLERADAMIPRYGAAIPRSMILRIAISRGLELMDKELPKAKRR